MITSKSNPQIKWLLQLQKKSKARTEEKVFVVEGIRMFAEVPRSRVEKVYLSESFYNKKKEELDLKNFPYEILSDAVFQHVSDTKTPQDPGNLGTIVRTAEGAGVDAIFLSKDCVDLYNSKTIRSTMGSIYRMPTIYVEDIPNLLEQFREKGIKSYAAHLQGKNSYDKENYQGGTAILIGNEGNGLRDEVSQKADVWVRIPMHGQVESLNAAIAASVMMFEVSRQRR